MNKEPGMDTNMHEWGEGHGLVTPGPAEPGTSDSPLINTHIFISENKWSPAEPASGCRFSCFSCLSWLESIKRGTTNTLNIQLTSNSPTSDEKARAFFAGLR